MDEVIVKGAKYISSKRAAMVSGYVRDYIGQLVRSGKLHAVKVGRSWYVREDQILQHVGSAEITDHHRQQDSTLQRAPATPLHIGASNLTGSWSKMTYLDDDGPNLPISDKREVQAISEISTNRAIEIPRSTFVSARASQNIVDLSAKRSSSALRDGTTVSTGLQTVNQDVLVLSRETIPNKYIEVSRYSRDWSYKALLTVTFSAAVALLMPIIL